MPKLTICVDFDGTIAEKTIDLDTFGPIIEGAREALNELKALGCRIIIYTSRTQRIGNLAAMPEFLTSQGIPFDAINPIHDTEAPSSKPLANIYIDDRALRFEGNWAFTLANTKNILGIT